MVRDELQRRFLFMFERHAGYIKVTAIDELTGIEIVMVGKTGTHKRLLKQLASTKLIRALKLKQATKDGPYGQQIDMGGWSDAED